MRVRPLRQLRHRPKYDGVIAGGKTNAISRAAANVAWDVRGHYLLYCTITNADGSAITGDDPHTQPIVDDLAQRHLAGLVR